MHIFAEESPGQFRLTTQGGDDVTGDAPVLRASRGQRGGTIRLTLGSVLSGLRVSVWLLALEARVVGQGLQDLADLVDHADGADEAEGR